MEREMWFLEAASRKRLQKRLMKRLQKRLMKPLKRVEWGEKKLGLLKENSILFKVTVNKINTFLNKRFICTISSCLTQSPVKILRFIETTTNKMYKPLFCQGLCPRSSPTFCVDHRQKCSSHFISDENISDTDMNFMLSNFSDWNYRTLCLFSRKLPTLYTVFSDCVVRIRIISALSYNAKS